MKKRINRDFIIFLILIPIFLFLTLFISSRMENMLPLYSVINKSKTGCSVFYEALKELDYPVDRAMNAISTYNNKGIHIAAGVGSFDVNSDEIREWVKDGGILVYLKNDMLTSIEYDISPEIGGDLNINKYHKGVIISMNAYSLTNKALTKNTNAAYELLQEISKYQYDKIYFNEGHLYSDVEKKSLWNYTPVGMKYIIYQFILVLIAFFYFKGKRFGKTIPLHEEVERSENEYLYSTASLYRQAKCWDLMVESYYKSLLRSITSTHESWLEYWEKESLPSYDKANMVYEFMNKENEKRSVKEYTKVVTTIEYLKSILKKRRGSYWRKMKK